MAKHNLVVKRGNDPNCVHDEFISEKLIGTCWRCGQVRDYNQKRLAGVLHIGQPGRNRTKKQDKPVKSEPALLEYREYLTVSPGL